MATLEFLGHPNISTILVENAIFSIYGPGAEIFAFFPLTMARTPPPEVQKTQSPYFRSWATNQKTKDNFFSSTFKV